jgi:hypothetical protein
VKKGLFNTRHSISSYLKVVLLTIILLYCSNGSASFNRQKIEFQPGTVQSAGLLGVLIQNPAWISYVEAPLLAGLYSRLYNLKELESGAIFLANRFNFGRLGIGFQTFGNELYGEQTYSVVYGKSIGENGTVGLTLNQYQLSISGYGSAQATGIDIGSMWHITESVNWELSYLNINSAHIGRAKESLPQQAFTGFSYELKDIMLLRGYLLHELDFKPRYGVYFNYQLLPWINGALNAVTDPIRMNLMISLQWKLMGLYYSVTSHPVLPFSHNFGLLLRF